MKYKIGDLIKNKYGNFDEFGYIISLVTGGITVVFFDSSTNETIFDFDYFEKYYKIL
jgi:hypothetical protein